MGSVLLVFAVLLMVKFLIPAFVSTILPVSGTVDESGSILGPVTGAVTPDVLPAQPQTNAEQGQVLQDPPSSEESQSSSTGDAGSLVEDQGTKPEENPGNEGPDGDSVPEEPDLPPWIGYKPARSIFGYEFGSITAAHGLEQMYEAGAEWVRRAIWWPDIEPRKGTYNWNNMSTIEDEFLRAHEKGMRVIVMVRGTPAWAQAAYPYNRPCGRIRQDEFESFAKFMRALVDRYSQDPYNVMYWEIWNEPDVDPVFITRGSEWMGCWGDIDDPYYGGEYYAEMLKVVYPEVKDANPEAQLLVGGLLLDCDPNNIPARRTECDASKFIEGILVGGAGPYFDGISFHAYDYNGKGLGLYSNPNWNSYSGTTGPVVIAKANYLKGLLEEYDAPGKFLINTETALLCHTGLKSVCETNKAIYVVQSYVAAYAVGLEANLWYFWQERDGGLLRSNLAILPAYKTYSFANQQLTGATYLREIEDTLPAVRAYEFEIEFGRLWVLWSMDGGTYQIELPEAPFVMVDAFGNELEAGMSIEVSPMPVYVKLYLYLPPNLQP